MTVFCKLFGEGEAALTGTALSAAWALKLTKTRLSNDKIRNTVYDL